jgi:hypothetical protein
MDVVLHQTFNCIVSLGLFENARDGREKTSDFKTELHITFILLLKSLPEERS